MGQSTSSHFAHNSDYSRHFSKIEEDARLPVTQSARTAMLVVRTNYYQCIVVIICGKSGQMGSTKTSHRQEAKPGIKEISLDFNSCFSTQR
jgi:hypothetical protein